MRSLNYRMAAALGLALVPVSWNALSPIVSRAEAEAAKQTPHTYAHSSLIRLPIVLDERTRTALSEIKLYVKPPGGDWVLVKAGTPAMTTFDFRAEKDGEYSFMFVTVDKAGRCMPGSLESRLPHQVIVIDTKPPELAVQPLPVGNTEIFLQCRMIDANPDLTTLKLEYPIGDNAWREMELVSPSSPGVFRIPFGSVLEGKVRASGRDKAGNFSERIVDFGDATKSFAQAGMPKAPEPLPNVVVKSEPPLIESAQPTVKMGAQQPNPIVTIPDPEPKPVPSNYNPNRPADPVVNQEAPPVIVDPKAADNSNVMQPAGMSANTSKKVNPFMEDPPAADSKPLPTETAVVRNDPPAVNPAPANNLPLKTDPPPAAQSDTGGQTSHIIINKPRCSLDYAVDNVVVGGQPKIEFWATADNGQSWFRVQDESSGGSPAKLVLPGDGVFGVRVRANGNGQAPQAGEAPDAWVEVDTTAPTVHLLPPIVSSGLDAGTLTIQWQAQDRNLIADSINIYRAGRPDGPWLPVALGLRNEGAYRWLIPAGIGSEIYFRLEATDRAGNVGRADLGNPVVIPQPKVRVIGIGPAR